ncbi:hypothetical protein ANO14919_108430 [Xylariales sp. No.14919]|nr:hypothetical protein ANO14919_108430 [Xylariales sp. No.14919]
MNLLNTLSAAAHILTLIDITQYYKQSNTSDVPKTTCVTTNFVVGSSLQLHPTVGKK